MSATPNQPSVWQQLLPQAKASDYKFSRGYALLLGGYPLTGAARLSARAAARMGTGVVTIAVPEIAFPIYAAACTSIMVRPLYPAQSLEDLQNLLADSRITALLAGPGLGAELNKDTDAPINASTSSHTLCLLNKRLPTVLDADALSVFHKDPDTLINALNPSCVLTPHEGEFARLFPNLEGDRLQRAQAAAKLCNAVVILKGHETLIASPNGKTYINQNAPATLATAGAGDVLSGIILGLLAQGMPAFEAAAAGVYIHGEAANLFGIGLMAEDLPDLLPKVMRGFI